MKNIVTRIGVTPSLAPFRISNLRTFFYTYALAQNNSLKGFNCKFFIRIDDSNPKKNIFNTNDILEFFSYLKIIPGTDKNHNNSLMVNVLEQSKQTQNYDEYFKYLSKKGFCIKDEKTQVVYFDLQKFKNHFGEYIYIEDKLLGTIKYCISTLSKNNKFPIRRSNGTFLYNFISPIDDYNLEVTHVVIGTNKLSTAVYHEIIRKSLNFPSVEYIHTPLLYENNEYPNISKRSLFMELVKVGIYSKALTSYILSSGYGEIDSIYKSLEEFSKEFDYKNIHKKSNNFDYKKLWSINSKFIKSMEYKEYKEYLNEFLKSNSFKYKYDNLFVKLSYNLKINAHLANELWVNINKSRFEEVDFDLLMIASDILKQINKNNYSDLEFILSLEHNYTKKNFYKSLRWILCGKSTGIDCVAILRYILDSNTLKKRIDYACEHLSKNLNYSI